MAGLGILCHRGEGERDPDVTHRPRRTGLLALLLATLTMIGPFSIDTMFPAFVDIEREFGVDAAAMQQTISIYLVAFAGDEPVPRADLRRGGPQAVIVVG